MEILNRYIFGQIDFETLAILFSLMLVVAGFTKLGYIDLLAEKMIKSAKNRRILLLLLIFACFFLSMLVTNDVALIIMVPFAIGVLEKSDNKERLIFMVVMQTIAANLGSMVTPIGNPQNVYLYQYYGMNPSQFFGTVMPYAAAAFCVIAVIVVLQKGGSEEVRISGELPGKAFIYKPVKTLICSVCLVICILSVLGVIDIFLTVLVVTALVLICDYKLIKDVNYGLLIKFVFLFIFVGNLAEVPVVKENLEKLAVGNEFVCGVVFSQFLSNVPAAIMLSRFTNDGAALLEGVNVGGLGSLIASMASMISYEYYGKTDNAQKKKYVVSFTVYNIVFLLIMILVKIIL